MASGIFLHIRHTKYIEDPYTLKTHVLCALPCLQTFERECNREKTLEKVAKENKVR